MFRRDPCFPPRVVLLSAEVIGVCDSVAVHVVLAAGGRIACVADAVIVGTPIDLTRILKINKPSVRVQYDLQETTHPGLAEVIQGLFASLQGRELVEEVSV